MTTSPPVTSSVADRALPIAAELFARHGYGETTTRQISAALGVTNGTFYHHFPSKEVLLRRICEDVLADLRARVEAAINHESDPEARLRALVTVHLRAIVEAQAAHITMLTEFRALRGEHRETVLAARDAYEAMVRRVVAEAQDDGFLAAGNGPDTLTKLLLNLLNWTIFWYRPDGDLSPEQLAQQMVRLFLDGARSRPIEG